MNKGRLEAFSDGVLAIIITVMVLEIKAPHGPLLHDLQEVWPNLVEYALSFLIVAIYWNNHHHLFQMVEKVNGRVLWANMHLLFWLSLIPFATDWLGRFGTATVPVASYGIVLIGAAVAYFTLTRVLIITHGIESTVATAVGGDFKGKISILIYLLAVGLSFVIPFFSYLLFAAVALIWLVPDRRAEKAVSRDIS